MNEGKHTPGPWRAITTETRFEIVGPDGFPILRINGGMLPIAANVALIEAAPDLLEALELAETWITEIFEQGACESDRLDLAKIRRAIAKVRAA